MKVRKLKQRLKAARLPLPLAPAPHGLGESVGAAAGAEVGDPVGDTVAEAVGEDEHSEEVRGEAVEEARFTMYLQTVSGTAGAGSGGAVEEPWTSSGGATIVSLDHVAALMNKPQFPTFKLKVSCPRSIVVCLLTGIDPNTLLPRHLSPSTHIYPYNEYEKRKQVGPGRYCSPRHPTRCELISV